MNWIVIGFSRSTELIQVYAPTSKSSVRKLYGFMTTGLTLIFFFLNVILIQEVGDDVSTQILFLYHLCIFMTIREI